MGDPKDKILSNGSPWSTEFHSIVTSSIEYTVGAMSCNRFTFSFLFFDLFRFYYLKYKYFYNFSLYCASY